MPTLRLPTSRQFFGMLHFNFISAKLTRAGAKNKNKIGEVPPKNAGSSTTTTTPRFQTQYLQKVKGDER